MIVWNVEKAYAAKQMKRSSVSMSSLIIRDTENVDKHKRLPAPAAPKRPNLCFNIKIHRGHFRFHGLTDGFVHESRPL